MGGKNPFHSYIQICQKNLDFLENAVGEKRPSSLQIFGLRIYGLGLFGRTAAAVGGQKAEPNLAPQSFAEKWIQDIGNTILSTANRGTFQDN